MEQYVIDKIKKLGEAIKRKDFDDIRWEYNRLKLELPHIGTDGVKFICPECQGTRLECCENGPYTSEVLNIDSEGDFDFSDVSPDGDVVRFQCLNCGHVLVDDNRNKITQHEEIVEWCKDHCRQE